MLIGGAVVIPLLVIFGICALISRRSNEDL
jgi:hypothetical protein